LVAEFAKRPFIALPKSDEVRHRFQVLEFLARGGEEIDRVVELNRLTSLIATKSPRLEARVLSGRFADALLIFIVERQTERVSERCERAFGGISFSLFSGGFVCFTRCRSEPVTCPCSFPNNGLISRPNANPHACNVGAGILAL